MLLLTGILTGCTFMRAAWHNTPTLSAPGSFDNRLVAVAPDTAPLPSAAAELVLSAALAGRHRTFDELLEANETRAFLVVRDDHVVYERYFGGLGRDSLVPTFSLSKTFAALLVGCAIDDGLIRSVQDPVTNYVPELAANDGYSAVQLDHLLRMVSGIDFEEESYDSATLYYCRDLHVSTLSFVVAHPPGTAYRYGSINVQLLWEVLHPQLGGRTVAQYFEERVWRRLGAEHAATWSIDSERSGVEKLFAGLNATARDLARLGLLFLHGGRWNGKQVVSPCWVARSIEPDPVAGLQTTVDGPVLRGHYQWFLTCDGRSFFAKGFRGQYLWVDPAARMVVVRIGEGYGSLDWPALFRAVADGLPAVAQR